MTRIEGHRGPWRPQGDDRPADAAATSADRRTFADRLAGQAPPAPASPSEVDLLGARIGAAAAAGLAGDAMVAHLVGAEVRASLGADVPQSAVDAAVDAFRTDPGLRGLFDDVVRRFGRPAT